MAEQNTVVMDDDEFDTFLRETKRSYLIEEWRELLDREPEEKWIELANRFLQKYEIDLKAISVNVDKDSVFNWTFEKLES